MKTGYARCSTNESKQDIERQVRELKQAGAERVFLEYEHGDAVVKEQLSLLLEQAQAGDTIITLEVSRLARSTKQLCEIISRVCRIFREYGLMPKRSSQIKAIRDLQRHDMSTISRSPTIMRSFRQDRDLGR